MVSKRLERKGQGALAKAARKAGKSVEVEVTTKATPGGATRLFDAKPTKAFERELKDALERDTRAYLNINVQGYILSVDAILDDISDDKSPFKWPNSSGTGKIYTPQELNSAAKTISKELYTFVKRTVRSEGLIRVSGSPKTIVSMIMKAAFNSPIGSTYAYDDSTRIIYFWSSKRSKAVTGVGRVDSFRKMTGFLGPKIDAWAKAKPPEHPVAVYWNPDPVWIQYKNAFVQDLKDKKVGATKRNEMLRQERIDYRNRTGTAGYEGTQFGHTFGAAATKAGEFLQNTHDLSHTYTGEVESLKIKEGFNSHGVAAVREAVKLIFDNDVRLDMEKKYSSQGVHGQLTLIMNENALSNAISGGKTDQGLKNLKGIVRSIGIAIQTWGASPSYVQLVEQLIQESFLGIRPKNSTYRAKGNIKIKSKASITTGTTQGFKGTVDYPETKAPSTSSNQDLNSLIRFLNEKLHDKIKDNMGKGGSKQVLNYRTGRFARSAKIQALYPVSEKNAIGAQVRYMKRPYKVFEPGGSHLATPGRNPARIFGRSIRQLLQEEKIANLRRVKVTLRG